MAPLKGGLKRGALGTMVSGVIGCAVGVKIGWGPWAAGRLWVGGCR